jgi:hypothetical protein
MFRQVFRSFSKVRGELLLTARMRSRESARWQMKYSISGVWVKKRSEV